MSNMTIQGLQKRRDFGMEKIRRQKYAEAKEDFQMIVDNLLIDNDQKAALKMKSYNQISLCEIELGNFSEAENAANEALSIFCMMRPEELKKKQFRKNDCLMQHFHTALVRHGQIFQKQKDYRKAISKYQDACRYYPKGEGKEMIQDCLIQFGIPPIDTEDQALLPYSKIYDNVLNPAGLLNCYQECIMKINQSLPTEEEIQKLDNGGIVQMILGVIGFLLENAGDPNHDVIIDISLTISSLFIRRGATKAWANASVLMDVVNHYKDNDKILGSCLNILKDCPSKKYSAFENEDFIRTWVNALNFELKSEQVEDIYSMLFYTLNNNIKLVDSICDTNILDKLLQSRTIGALVLVSRLVQSDGMAKKSKTNGIIDWAFSVISENLTNEPYIQACLIILSRIFMFTEEEEGFNINNMSARAYKEFMPVIIKNQKNPTTLIDIYVVLTKLLEYAIEQIRECKILLISSVLLSANIENEKMVLAILKFFYRGAKFGLIEDLISVKPILPTCIKVLERYSNFQEFVEIAISLAVEMKHPNKEQLLQSGLVQFPKSQMLKQYVDVLKAALQGTKLQF